MRLLPRCQQITGVEQLERDCERFVGQEINCAVLCERELRHQARNSTWSALSHAVSLYSQLRVRLPGLLDNLKGQNQITPQGYACTHSHQLTFPLAVFAQQLFATADKLFVAKFHDVAETVYDRYLAHIATFEPRSAAELQERITGKVNHQRILWCYSAVAMSAGVCSVQQSDLRVSAAHSAVIRHRRDVLSTCLFVCLRTAMPR